MIRAFVAVIGVIAGYLVWTLVWLGGNSLFFAESQKTVAEGKVFDATVPLIGLLVLSVVASLASGVVCAAITRKQSRRAVWILAFALLATGIAVQAKFWNLEPAWFHVLFLALLVPVTRMGAGLVKSATLAT